MLFFVNKTIIGHSVSNIVLYSDVSDIQYVAEVNKDLSKI